MSANVSLVFYHRKKLGLKANRYRNLGRRFVDQLIALNERGLNDSEIAEELGINRYTVKSRRRKLGLKGHSRRLLFTDQQLIDLHEEGLDDQEKAERLGASKAAVFDRRKKLGLKANRYRNLGRRFVDQLIALNERRLNDSEIAEELGINRYTVKSRRRKLGLKTVSRPRKS